MGEDASNDGQARFAIFRSGDPRAGEEADAMESEPITPIEAEGARRVVEAGFDEGHHVKRVFAMAGMSLTYCWFKSGFPLPRHSHSADCLYYIVGGSLRIGHDEFGVGDGSWRTTPSSGTRRWKP